MAIESYSVRGPCPYRRYKMAPRVLTTSKETGRALVSIAEFSGLCDACNDMNIYYHHDMGGADISCSLCNDQGHKFCEDCGGSTVMKVEGCRPIQGTCLSCVRGLALPPQAEKCACWDGWIVDGTPGGHDCESCDGTGFKIILRFALSEPVKISELISTVAAIADYDEINIDVIEMVRWLHCGCPRCVARENNQRELIKDAESIGIQCIDAL